MPIPSDARKVQADVLAGQVERRLGTRPDLLVAVWVSPLGTWLQESEAQLIALMDGEQPGTNAPGSIEFGIVLYWLDTDHPELAKLLRLPPTAITSAMLSDWYTILMNQGVVYADGTLIGFSTYMQLDPGWLLAAASYLALLTGIISKAAFGSTPATVTVPGISTITIALTGDWGTGSWTDGGLACPSEQVIAQIQKLAPDFTIHLGDVYFAGFADEETDNLLKPWSAGSQGTFTLNSNHEMYDGGNGYFGTALASGVFKGQQGTSYFAIDGGSWVVVGLDSAYYSTSLLFDTGAVTDSGQLAFLKNLDMANKKVIVLTHHNPLTVDGTGFVSSGSGAGTQSLWGDVAAALGRAPDSWYWGHIHNGIIYSSQSAAGTGTLARCVGHGALPFGSAYELLRQGQLIPSVDYFTRTPLSTAFPKTTPQQQNRVLNGFVLLTLGPNGISEQLYDQTGEVVWSSDTP